MSDSSAEVGEVTFEGLVDQIVERTGWERDWVEDVATPRYPCQVCHGRGTVPAITEAKKIEGAQLVLRTLDRVKP